MSETSLGQTANKTLPRFKPTPLGTKQWEDLCRADPLEVCRRALVTWNPEGFYAIPFLNSTYKVFPNRQTVESDTSDPLTKNPEFCLVLTCYLLLSQDVPEQSRWVSEKELREGSLFFTGPHALPAIALVKQFGNDPAAFLAAGRKIGGIELPSYGDTAVVFQVLPRISCACVLWSGDDEFPARASFLFDPSADIHLSLDIITAMVRYLVKGLVKAALA